MGHTYAISVVGKKQNVLEFDVIFIGHDHEGTPHPNPANPSFFFFLIADEIGPGKPALVKELSADDRNDEAWVAEHAGEYIANVEVVTTSGYPGMRDDMPLVK